MVVGVEGLVHRGRAEPGRDRQPFRRIAVRDDGRVDRRHPGLALLGGDVGVRGLAAPQLRRGQRLERLGIGVEVRVDARLELALVELGVADRAQVVDLRLDERRVLVVPLGRALELGALVVGIDVGRVERAVSAERGSVTVPPRGDAGAARLQRAALQGRHRGSGPTAGYATAPMSSRETIDLAPPVEKAFLVAVDTGDDEGWTAEDSLTELATLATTAGAEVVGAEWQNRRHVDPNWYVGKGKAEELLQAKSETGFDILVADDELSPGPAEGLESLLNVKVIDRSRLILDIFALHAQTHEGRLQVELAQLEYQLPRLTRLWTHLSRTQGGIGSRGPGETQLETDRRIIRDADQEDEGAGRAGPPAARDGGPRPRPAPVPDGRASSATRTPASRRCSTRSSAARSPRPRTSCSRRSTRPRARSSSATARPRSSPTPWASSTSCRTSSSTRSGRRSRRSTAPTS